MATLIHVVTTLAIMTVIFLIGRAVVLWYWRVGEGIELLKSIDAKLAVLTGQPARKQQTESLQSRQ